MHASTQGAVATRRDTVLGGIARHFQLRVTSWFMASVLLGIGVVVTVNPESIAQRGATSASIVHMTRLASPAAWGVAFLTIAVVRLLALAVNGSMHWSPQVRMVMSTASSLMLAQLVLSATWGVPPTICTVVYPLLLALELYNTAAAALEAPRR